jgi:hypothetical protein
MSRLPTHLLHGLDPSSVQTYIPFGKYRGQTLQEVSDDTGYLRWLLSLSGEGVAADFVHYNREAIEAVLCAEADAKAATADPIIVTPHQQDAVDLLYSLIKAGEPVVRLSGGAGYGKSYTIKKLLMTLREQDGIQSCAAATSYVATQVLAQGLDPYGIESATIARTLKLQKIFEDGVESYNLSQDSREAARDLMSPGRALVIDEDSMVGDEIATLLLEEGSGGTLILVGDRHQLPPVGQDRVSLCCATPDTLTAELTEPMRYSRESVLYALEQTVRHCPNRLIEELNNTELGESIIRTQTADDMVEKFVDNYKNDSQASHRMLLFRRQDVIDANNSIRLLIYGYFAEDVEPDERLMILRTSDFPYVKKSQMGDTTRYYSGENFVVEECEKSSHLGIPHWRLKLKGRPNPVRVIFAVSESKMDETRLGGVEYSTAMRQSYELGRETKNWEPMRQLQADFLSVAYTYCTSIHRAQGQTVDYAYSIPGQLMSVKGLLGQALLYVALTRAKKQCVVRA